MKLIEKILKEASDIKIPKMKLNGIFYHGTVVRNNEMFSTFEPSKYSNTNATWFSSDEYISDEFGAEKMAYENDVQIMFKVTIKSSKIANISNELSREIFDFYGYNNTHDIIPMLKRRGFEGWLTLASIAHIKYDDYAIFNLNCVKILGVKLKIDNKWSNYVSLDKAYKYFEQKEEL